MSDNRSHTKGDLPTSSMVSEVENLVGFTFPESYVNYLFTQNGMDGFVGTNYVRFYSAQNLTDENYEEWKEFFPNTLRIGDTGALENFVINYDFTPPRFGMLPHIGDKGDFIDLGGKWSQLIRRLEEDSIFERKIRLTIDGLKATVDAGTTVAVAILSSGINKFRSSVSGEARGPLCGMGICFECRVTINGEMHQTSCTRLVEDGMEILTGE